MVDGLKKYGIIEELYVRGLLLNLIEKIFAKSKNSTLLAVVLSAVIFGTGHIFGVVNQSPLVIVSKVVWTIGMGMFFGIVYKKQIIYGYRLCSTLLSMSALCLMAFQV